MNAVAAGLRANIKNRITHTFSRGVENLVLIGKADAQAQRAYDVLWRATEAGIGAARSGNSCRDLFESMAQVIAEIDDSGADIGRLGHGLGMQLTEQPSHAAFDNTVLREGMVLTLEPSLCYHNGLMMVHEEDIVVGDNGAKLLTTRAAPQLPVIRPVRQV